jgi:hypothetical protein
MPDPFVILKASAVAAGLAALIALVLGWPWRQSRPARRAAGGALGVGAGFLIGTWLLGFPPHYPPQEDQDRLLLILLPAAVAVEVAAAVLGRRWWLAWPLRLAVAAGAARVMLHGSVYISISALESQLQWTAETTWLILGGLAAGLAANWALQNQLARQPSSWPILAALAFAIVGAGLTIMLSGYASGGQFGFTLAASLAGVAAVSVVKPAGGDLRGAIGVAVVGLFAMLVAGRFFGDLTTTNGVLLFFAPLLVGLPVWVPVRRIGPILRTAAGLILAAAPVAVALSLALQQFRADSAAPSDAPGANEPSLEDYMNISK